ncbi:T9SS type A sorting domain-containing protein [Mucilaginibacter myungsuensis]|uniref:T9SS type A sorting domain-containing protein n=1 Tax=Mucilaginibacter myungsuensis TaxID=649104 RepID=A0A929L7N5_9SPHI|nr:T9SS type A sorting domain-containing protein [Mucilaginibacter myungsuensis]MBE9664681.1 T9SS type A sorting domain-containing protein [Mucilaginibacter myungsuensis]MDN3601462.1 T9SS type A sorting domain-containing protein [Mucilaginibacter myungsuensis]
MNKSYTKILSRTLLLLAVLCLNFAIAGAVQVQKADTTYYRPLKTKKDKSFLKSVFSPSMPAVKTYNIPVSKPAQVLDDKLLNNVQVYPNPTTDQISVKYTITRDANVTIKLMDVLGNQVATLFTGRNQPGEYKNASNLPKLNTGFYFVRVIANTESVVKRVSIL